jgi:hypothetical protein
MLATPFQSGKPAAAQPVPDAIFRARGRTPHVPRVLEESRWRLHTMTLPRRRDFSTRRGGPLIRASRTFSPRGGEKDSQ